ncbi:hypothetical protein [Melghirimyces algeriensis]|uniref:hypothetical protein n=1 Tax=Melghirimyces algeriensis TaxID=910412 RepID=UPI001C8F23AA|nr:hypothetical protein [Melghirimyces algeriensis]
MNVKVGDWLKLSWSERMNRLYRVSQSQFDQRLRKGVKNGDWKPSHTGSDAGEYKKSHAQSGLTQKTELSSMIPQPWGN